MLNGISVVLVGDACVVVVEAEVVGIDVDGTYEPLKTFNLKEYIYAHDYSTSNHKSSITDEEKQVCIKNNWDKFFNEPIKSVFLPL